MIPQWLPPYLLPFVTLSYPTNTPSVVDSFPSSSYYNTGPLDACLIISLIAIMAVLRDAFRLGIMEPFARWKLMRDLDKKKARRAIRMINIQPNGKINGISNSNGHAVHVKGDMVSSSRKEVRQVHRSVLRFAEQGWSFIYYSVQWSYGIYLHLNLPTRLLDPTHIWELYPHIPLPGPVKFYYLTQNAFYLHQVLILNAEAPRKDHVQMMTHHVVTIVLMLSSYFGNFTRAGCLIMVLMDCSDIFLPLAKMLRYLSLTRLCDICFVIFLVSWFVSRHILFIFAILSTYRDGPRLIPFVWDPERGLYWTQETWLIFCGMLSMLQILQIIWFTTICRVAWRVISGQNATDDRSDESDFVQEDEKET